MNKLPLILTVVLAGFLTACTTQQVRPNLPPAPSLSGVKHYAAQLQDNNMDEQEDMKVIEAVPAPSPAFTVAVTNLAANIIEDSNTIVSLTNEVAAQDVKISNVVSDDTQKTITVGKQAEAIKKQDTKLIEDSKAITGFVLLIAIVVTSIASGKIRPIFLTPPTIYGAIAVIVVDSIVFAATIALLLEGIHIFGLPFPPIFGR